MIPWFGGLKEKKREETNHGQERVSEERGEKGEVEGEGAAAAADETFLFFSFLLISYFLFCFCLFCLT